MEIYRPNDNNSEGKEGKNKTGDLCVLLLSFFLSVLTLLVVNYIGLAVVCG